MDILSLRGIPRIIDIVAIFNGIPHYGKPPILLYTYICQLWGKVQLLAGTSPQSRPEARAEARPYVGEYLLPQVAASLAVSSFDDSEI
jgi:hypothetical protein